MKSCYPFLLSDTPKLIIVFPAKLSFKYQVYMAHSEFMHHLDALRLELRP